MVQVPSVDGQSLEQAMATLNGVGLVPVVRYEDNDAESGTVLGTDPAAATPVAPGARVTIRVSNGPATPTTTPPVTTSPTPTPTGSG
jgi:serine/threonine-protein kinase